MAGNSERGLRKKPNQPTTNLFKKNPKEITNKQVGFSDNTPEKPTNK